MPCEGALVAPSPPLHQKFQLGGRSQAAVGVDALHDVECAVLAGFRLNVSGRVLVDDCGAQVRGDDCVSHLVVIKTLDNKRYLA